MPPDFPLLIAEEEERLVALKAECAASELRLAELRQALAASRSQQIISPAQLSSDDKIALFRTLFRGRNDAFPLLWARIAEKRRTGMRGLGYHEA